MAYFYCDHSVFFLSAGGMLMLSRLMLSSTIFPSASLR